MELKPRAQGPTEETAGSAVAGAERAGPREQGATEAPGSAVAGEPVAKRKKGTDDAGELVAKRKGTDDAGESVVKRKEARRAPPTGSSSPWFDHERFGSDTWTEVAKHMGGSDLVSLSQTSTWLRRLVADDSMWRYAVIRDLGLPGIANSLHTPRPPHRTWRNLYCTTIDGSHAFLPSAMELCGWRVGGFILDAPEVLLTTTLPLPQLHGNCARGACVLSNARPGLWIADMQVTRCPGCTIDRCKGTIQVLEARHLDILPEQQSLQYDNVGDYLVQEEVPSAFCGIFSPQHVTSCSTATILDLKSWIAERNLLEPRTCIGTHAVAVHSNLQSNMGLLSMFLVARDTSGNGQIISLRLVQLLC